VVTNPLHKVAERIGMELCEGEEWAAGGVVWFDREYVQDDLRTYLLTGDRPLRILEREKINLMPERGQWRAEVYAGDTIETLIASAERPTPAEAILACAEACV
jgi:hypothetical protein